MLWFYTASLQHFTYITKVPSESGHFVVHNIGMIRVEQWDDGVLVKVGFKHAKSAITYTATH
jgi:hypothetical protein